MKKRLLSFILLLVAGITATYAYDFSAVAPSGQTLYYNVTSSGSSPEVSVTYPGSWGDGYTQPTGSLTIPSSVTYGVTTYSVTSIGESAFYGGNDLTSVNIPNSVTSIGNSAFRGCCWLTSMTIPNSVTSIGDYAFSGCRSLTSVTIGNSVTSIGYGVFSYCSRLTSVTVSSGNTVFDSRSNCNAIIHTATNTLVAGCQNTTIPNSVTSIGDRAFWYCDSLTSVTIPNSVTSIGNSAFVYCTGLTSVTIPNSVTTIEGSAFYSCSSLTSIVIGNSVTSIGSNVFSDCDGLTSITIPNSVTSIGDYAFSGCRSLTSVTIGNSVTSIGYGVFSYCSRLTSVTVSSGNTVFDSRSNCNAIIHTATNTLVAGCQNTTIPNSVTSIGDRAFCYCDSLTSVTIPNSVTSIGNSAFVYCTGLTSVTIPNSVTSIGNSAFVYCTGLTSVTIPNSVTTIGTQAFENCRNLTSVTISNSLTSIGYSAFYGCSSLTSVTIPSSVTSIGQSAFYGCSSLTSVTIPSSVTSIGNMAFRRCSGLTSVTAKWVVAPSTGSGTFYNVPSNIPVYIPCGSSSSYSSASGWNHFTNFIEVMFDSVHVVSADESMGTAAVVTQPTCESPTATIAATPNTGYTFVNWTEDSAVVSTDATYTFSVTADRTLTAHFAPESTCGIAPTDLPYTDNFDSYTTSTTAKTGVEPDCWTLANQYVDMTDEYKPMIYYSSANAHSGSYSLILNKRGIYAMPEYDGDVSTLQLSMYVKQGMAKYQLQVGVMSDLTDASTFVTVATINNSSTAPVLNTVSFANYTGSGHFIAFRNILASGYSGDFSCNYIDDLVLDILPANTCGISTDDLPYTDNFDSYTTSTTAKTGVEPDCWTLAHQDVAITDEYKPMIYYASSNAHSGSYSLLLNKRGIYAMPEFDGEIRSLQLSMYVKQGQAKYQLQVGVMSNLSDANTFVPVATINNSTTGYVLNTVSFASYSGNGRFIAFRNVLPSGQTGAFSCNYIDDITLEVRPSECVAITTADLPYSDNFDSYTTSTTAKTGVEVPCWTLAHQDVTMADEYKPMVYYSSAHSHSGSYSIILNKRGIFAMPEFDGDVSSLQLSFYVRQTQAKYQLQVGVMSDLSNAGTFVPVATINNSSTSASVLQTVDFASYSGSGRYIAFRNVLASGQSGDYSCNYIDDITLELRPSSCPAITAADLPYTENFDSYTTSTTAKTGVSVPCWTLAHQDVSMTDEYKPMVYYSSAHSHSGSYSIILNKRGIFAMPEFDGNVSSLQLSFYVRQTQAKYQLQVGVMSDLSNASTFVPVATINNSSTTASVLQTVDFASYSGSGRYIAFRNVLASGQSGDYSCNYIDDILLELRPSSCPAITAADLPYTENFDSQTTSTTAYTGVEPPCWTLALQEVTMSNAEKPMIYYGSSNAHSGNYSLILNKRGIYAMPEFEGNINELIMGFYVLQTQDSYKLTVGVMSDFSDPNTFTPVATANNSSTSEYMYHEVDFSSYEGNGKYIVFRNTNTAISNYSVNYIDDISLRRITPPCGISIADLPYTDNFDSYTSSTTAKTGVEPTCWTLALQEVSMTDEYKPMVYYGSATSHSGNYSLILNKRGIYAMPAYNGDISSLQMNFYLKQTRSTYELTVGVMDDLDDPDTFEPIASFNNSTTDYVSCTVDFSSYSGMGNYIVFRNTNNAISDFSVNYIDDISLTSRANNCNIQINDLPYTDNFDSYTTSTTAKTGVTPECWTLAHQDIAMTDEYKPMVYYSSAQAHSGNYSIILNKRGIFAMPQYLGNVRDLQLTFYLCQTQAKYQLQVGVMSDLSNASTFVPVATFNNSSTTASVLRTVNFSAYTGSGHYIAFRNILASGQTGDYSCNYIDDITLSLAASKGLDGNGNDVSDNEPLSQKWMTVFPNPTSGLITVEADGEIERIDIFDYTGRCVATFEHQSSVDLSGFASGLYTLRCTLPDRIEVRRVVKQ